MRKWDDFVEADSGAVTVDWVVLTAAIVGLGLATAAVVGGGVASQSGNISGQLASDMISTRFGEELSGYDWNGSTAYDYWLIGATAAPGNNGATYGIAQMEAAEDAPAGFNFTNPIYDPDTGNVIYTSDDGQYYASGGEIYAVGDYPGTPQYWGA